STGRGVAVTVIDTGADTEHPDLRGKGIQTTNFVEGGEPSFPLDRHGTAVAGVIGARADGVGLEGVAPDATLSVVKACWYSDPASAKALCSSWTLAKAADFAINNGAKVINLSLNGRPDDLLARLLAAAHRRGIVLVAAAAEDRDNPGFPAALDTVIPVISCDVNSAVSSPRWRSAAFVAVAPGQDIVAPAPQGRYALLSGSSLAAAHVTGVAALLLQHQPGLSPDQVKTLLQASARPAPAARPELGIVDACAALNLAAPELTCP
ncbi:MAG: S8 family serine peptidase, partial [Candidatus Contendobacter sp.]|nr:S8 family serine peptidase [Candidatus Contendobacter sp.]